MRRTPTARRRIQLMTLMPYRQRGHSLYERGHRLWPRGSSKAAFTDGSALPETRLRPPKGVISSRAGYALRQPVTDMVINGDAYDQFLVHEGSRSPTPSVSVTPPDEVDFGGVMTGTALTGLLGSSVRRLRGDVIPVGGRWQRHLHGSAHRHHGSQNSQWA